MKCESCKATLVEAHCTLVWNIHLTPFKHMLCHFKKWQKEENGMALSPDFKPPAVVWKWSVKLISPSETTDHKNLTRWQIYLLGAACYSLIFSCLCILSTFLSLYWAWMVLQWPMSSTNSLDKIVCWQKESERKRKQSEKTNVVVISLKISPKPAVIFTMSGHYR